MTKQILLKPLQNIYDGNHETKIPWNYDYQKYWNYSIRPQLKANQIFK